MFGKFPLGYGAIPFGVVVERAVDAAVAEGVVRTLIDTTSSDRGDDSCPGVDFSYAAVQEIGEHLSIPLPVVDLRSVAEHERQAAIDRQIAAEIVTGRVSPVDGARRIAAENALPTAARLLLEQAMLQP